METLLRLSGHLFDFITERQILLPASKEAGHVGPVLIGPRGFHQYPSEVTVTGFGDASALHAIPTGVFARDQAALAHQLPGALETGQRAKFGDDRGGRRLRNSAQCLQ